VRAAVGAPHVPIWDYSVNSEWIKSNGSHGRELALRHHEGAEWTAANPEAAVALFEKAYPLGRLIIMGGSLKEAGNVTSAAEFNVWYDPKAAGREPEDRPRRRPLVVRIGKGPGLVEAKPTPSSTWPGREHIGH